MTCLLEILSEEKELALLLHSLNIELPDKIKSKFVKLGAQGLKIKLAQPNEEGPKLTEILMDKDFE